LVKVTLVIGILLLIIPGRLKHKQGTPRSHTCSSHLPSDSHKTRPSFECRKEVGGWCQAFLFPLLVETELVHWD
jgi:hypothetical protein